jgi:hypothetical protein
MNRVFQRRRQVLKAGLGGLAAAIPIWGRAARDPGEGLLGFDAISAPLPTPSACRRAPARGWRPDRDVTIASYKLAALFLIAGVTERGPR